ncbi:MAG TPA: biotin--[acetyl-CoA-carboxylase] ligase [Acidobacteriota bacterium]|nr:biotin--[acetyl-CoA-carboxylase] ligase [Acidobacteriota bacterium]
MFQICECLETVTSTNDYLKQFVSDGVPRLVMAAEQTAGKGQYGRKWESHRGEGLYVSYLIYPRWKAEQARFLNFLASLAVVDAVAKQGGDKLPLRLKEPNDVLVGSRKLAGILIELGTCGRELQWVIVGIGINLFQHAFNGALAASATSLSIEGVRVTSAADFCDTLNKAFLKQYKRVSDGGWEAVEQDYRQLLNRKNNEYFQL